MTVMEGRRKACVASSIVSTRQLPKLGIGPNDVRQTSRMHTSPVYANRGPTLAILAGRLPTLWALKLDSEHDIVPIVAQTQRQRWTKSTPSSRIRQQLQYASHDTARLRATEASTHPDVSSAAAPRAEHQGGCEHARRLITYFGLLWM